MAIQVHEYEDMCNETAVYPSENGLVYTTLGLAGEAGEFANKVKKLLRGDAGVAEMRDALLEELGDCLWYVTRAARELGSDLQEIMERNTEKLLSRKERGTLTGSGDCR